MSDTTYNSANGPMGGSQAEYNGGNTGSGTFTINLNNSVNQRFTLTGNITVSLINPRAGYFYRLRPIQNATGFFTIAWPSNIYWYDSVTPINSPFPNSVDMVELYYDGTNFWGYYSYDYKYQMQTTRYRSLALDGSNEYINFGNLALLNFEKTDAWSCGCWIKQPNGAGDNGSIISKNTTAQDFGWDFEITNNGGFKPSFYLVSDTAGTLVDANGATAIDNGQWRHIIATYDGSANASGIQIYVDGVAQTMVITHNDALTSIQNSANVTIGSNNGSVFFLQARLKDVSVWDRELSQGDVSELYAFGLFKSWPGNLRTMPRTKSNLIFWARCGDDPLDDATADTGVIVEQIYGNNGTPKNTEVGDIVIDAPNL